MNVNWLADYNFLANLQGGAEMSDREAYIYGLKSGRTMQLFNPESMQMIDMGKADLTVISNAARFDLGWILRTICVKPYVNYIHDYWPLCKYRLFYPMLEKCKKCESLGLVKQLMMNSQLNIFLSPLHFDAWCFAIPELKDRPHHFHPSPVNLELFKPRPDIKRNPKAGLVVNAAAFKGVKNTVAYCEKHPEFTFTFVGGPPEGIPMPQNCVYFGAVSAMAMPEMYAQATCYVELPDTPQPYNRTVLEARLMEVPHLILNRNIGAVSYDWFKEDTASIRKHIEEAVPAWWRKVEAAL